MENSKLTHNTKTLDPSIEHEIIDHKGMQVIVLFKTGKQEIYNDITEVHWMYPPFKECVALESDILATGWTPAIDRIERLVILDKADFEKITNDFHHDLKEAAHWFGGYDKLREVIAMLEDNENEANFDRWSERRYSIDG